MRDDMGFNVARSQPTRQPETVTAGLGDNSDAFDPVSCLLRFLSPTIEQLQQCALVDRELLQRLALDAWNDTGDEPTRLAHLDHGNQCCILFKSYKGSAQIVQLWHGALR